jgi:hypothetical protein
MIYLDAVVVLLEAGALAAVIPAALLDAGAVPVKAGAARLSRVDWEFVQVVVAIEDPAGFIKLNDPESSLRTFAFFPPCIDYIIAGCCSCYRVDINCSILGIRGAAACWSFSRCKDGKQHSNNCHKGKSNSYSFLHISTSVNNNNKHSNYKKFLKITSAN